MQNNKKSIEQKQVWGISLALIILTSLTLIICGVAAYYLCRAFIAVGDQSTINQIANSIELGYATTLENGILSIGDTSINISELLNRGLTFLSIATAICLVGSILGLIAAILGVANAYNLSKYKLLFGWGFAGIVGSILSISLVSLILFIIFVYKVHSKRFEAEELSSTAKHLKHLQLKKERSV